MSKMRVYTGLVISLFTLMIMFGCGAGRDLPDSQRLLGDARVNMRSGNTYMNYEEFDLALERYLDVIEDYPEHIEALKKAGDIYFHYAETQPGMADEYYKTAYNYYDRAIESFEKIQQEGDFPQFMEDVQDARIKKTAAWARLFNIGQDRFAQEQPDAALEIFYNLADLTPDSTNTYIMIASIYQAQDEADEAASYFETIAEIDETDLVSRRNLAAYHFARQNYEESLTWYEEITDIVPEDPDTYYMKGIVYMNMEDKAEEALSAFEQAYELDNDFIDAAINAANLAFNLQDFDKTSKYFKIVHEAEPENQEVLLYLLYALNYQENYEDMLEYGKKLYELDNQSVEAVQFIVLAATRLDKPEIQSEYLEILNELE